MQTCVDEAVIDNHVVLSMKGNRLTSRRGYSMKAIDLISQCIDELETVDVLPAPPHYREALKEKNDWETIPQTLVDDEFVGGSDILEELDERGDPETTLTGAN